ncbi:MAG: hypothetical protein H6566_26900 [Lewinellaceae bacterium]|nr:hypothetical protein [Lewinellaceae bacterium]
MHRLDRVTSGVLLMVQKKSALKELNRQFAERQIKKIYLAVVEQAPRLQQESWSTGYSKTSPISGQWCLNNNAKTRFLQPFLPHPGRGLVGNPPRHW